MAPCKLIAEAGKCSMRCRGMLQCYLHLQALVHKWNEPYLPLPYIYRPQGRGIEGRVGLGTAMVSK